LPRPELANALALAVAEALLRRGGQLVPLLANHALGAELFGVLAEDGFVPVDGAEYGDHGLVVGDLVLAAAEQDGGLVVGGDGLDVEARGCGG